MYIFGYLTQNTPLIHANIHISGPSLFLLFYMLAKFDFTRQRNKQDIPDIIFNFKTNLQIFILNWRLRTLNIKGTTAPEEFFIKYTARKHS